jgi:KDO2-lipid IV(A) lauroyltransferase
MAQKYYLFPEPWIKKLPALQNIAWFLEASILRLLMWTLQIMPVELAYRIAVRFCQIVEPLAPFTAKFSRNLSVAFPDKSAREIKQLASRGCANIGNAIGDLVRSKTIWEEREQRIQFVMKDGVDLRNSAGQPAIFVTAHIGAWQFTSFVAAKYNLSMTSVYAPENNPYLHTLVNGLRADLPCSFILKKGCMRGLMATLKQGNVVGFVPDLRLDGGELIPFFGVNAPSNTTAARLALHHGCNLIPIRAERLPDCHFRITVFPPIHPDDPNASIDIQARQMTQKQLALFETWIADTPDQWLCVGPRWGEDAYAPVENTVETSEHDEVTDC